MEANIERSTVPAKRKNVKLSVVVPAYNETERLPAMLNEAIAVRVTLRPFLFSM